MNALTLHTINNEALVLDTDLATNLGMAAPRNVRTKIIASNTDELLSYGELCTVRVQTGGRPATAFYLNEEQALLVCMFSKTANAAAVRKQVITTFMAHRRGQLPQAPTLMSADLADMELRLTAAFDERLFSMTRLSLAVHGQMGELYQRAAGAVPLSRIDPTARFSSPGYIAPQNPLNALLGRHVTGVNAGPAGDYPSPKHNRNFAASEPNSRTPSCSPSSPSRTTASSPTAATWLTSSRRPAAMCFGTSTL